LKLLLDNCHDTQGAVQAALKHTAPDFSPGLPGLTKLISKLSKEGCWKKALAIFGSLSALGLSADTTITNAAIAACGVAQDAWLAHEIFEGMPKYGIAPDTITYKAMVAALTRCGEWESCVKVCTCVTELIENQDLPGLLSVKVSLTRTMYCNLMCGVRYCHAFVCE
jgi:pentatricopeptide repeat protein